MPSPCLRRLSLLRAAALAAVLLLAVGAAMAMAGGWLFPDPGNPPGSAPISPPGKRADRHETAAGADGKLYAVWRRKHDTSDNRIIELGIFTPGGGRAPPPSRRRSR